MSECGSHEQALTGNSLSSAESLSLSPTELMAQASVAFGMALGRGTVQPRHADRSTQHANVDYSRCLLKREPRYLKYLNLLSFPLLAVSGKACD